MSLFQTLLGVLAVSIVGMVAIVAMIAFAALWAAVDLYSKDQLGRFWRKERENKPKTADDPDRFIQ